MSIMLYVYSRIFQEVYSRQSRITRTEVSKHFYNISYPNNVHTHFSPSSIFIIFLHPQACERAIDLENDYVTSEIDSSYPQCSKDMVLNAGCDVPHTTLYELLEYAKSRSILRNSMQSENPKTMGNHHSHHSTFSIRPTSSVQFNNHSTASDCSSSINTKKMPIRISSLKRESKTAQTLR